MKKITNFGIFTLLFVSSLIVMVGAVIAPSLSGIIEHLNFNYSPGLLITLPSLGVVVFASLVGRFLPKTGAFKMLCLGLIPYALLGVAGAFINNDYVLILDRFLLGGATVAIQISVGSFIADCFTGEKRMKLIAWQGMAVELGGVIFLSIGGVLGELNWQYPFYIYLIALVCFLFVLKTLPNYSGKIESEEESLPPEKEDSAKVKMIFMAALLAMVLFFVSLVTLPIYLPESFGFSESLIGYYMAFISVVAVVTASQMPKMVARFGAENTVVVGFLFFLLGYVSLVTSVTIIFLILTSIFIGIGFGFTIPLLNHMMIEASSNETLGKNLGLYSMGVFGGQFLSTFIDYISEDYVIIYNVAAILALLIALGMFFAFKKLKS